MVYGPSSLREREDNVTVIAFRTIPAAYIPPTGDVTDADAR